MIAVIAVLLLAATETRAALTPACSVAAASFVSSLPFNGCTITLAALLQDTTGISTCSSFPSDLNCMNPYQLNSRPLPSYYNAPLSRLPVEDVSSAPCALCSAWPDCRSSLGALTTAVLTEGDAAHLAQALGGAAPSTALQAAASAAATACSSQGDALALTVLREQAGVSCSRYETEGAGMTAPANSSSGSGNSVRFVGNGRAHLAALPQCSECGVKPCVPGMLCRANELPVMCPAGSYCTDTTTAVPCPEGYFCPQGSTAPLKCRATAAGSCPEGSAREVVWVPLLVAVAILAILVGVRRHPPAALAPVFGYSRPPQEGTASPPPSPSTKQQPAHLSVTLPPAAAQPVQPPATGLVVSFSDLRLTTRGNVRLDGVSGRFVPGAFTALVGNSGAGKTTLASVLLGREGASSGTVAYTLPGSTTPIPRAVLNRVIGFVPQVDVLLPSLTVEQALLHSARSRLPTRCTAAEVRAKVDSVLARLGISQLRHVLIGVAGSGGLGGGDRKLVNIAVELVADPLCVVFDEPTTALDASSAYKVAVIIRSLAREGLTCIAVIHQPRSEIFRLIDHLMVLVKGGKLAYDGPGQGALPYLASLGYPAPAHCNPADFIMDCLNGAVQQQPKSAAEADTTHGEVAAASASAAVPETWASYWRGTGAAFVATWAAARHQTVEGTATPPATPVLKAAPVAVPSTATATAATAVVHQLSEKEEKARIAALAAGRPGLMRQAWLFAKRAALQRMKGALLLDLTAFLIAGCVIGIVGAGGPTLLLPVPPMYSTSCPPGAGLKCVAWLRMMAEPLTFYITMVAGAIGIPAAVRAFGDERDVFHRESFAGASTTAYFLGKLVADIPYALLCSFMFTASFTAIAPARGPTEGYYALLACLAIFIMSLGYALSLALAEADSAVLVGTIIAILMNLFGGFVPRIGDTAVWAYTRYMARAIVATEISEGYAIPDSLFNRVVPTPHETPSPDRDRGIVIIFALITYTIAYGLLLKSNKARKSV